MIPAVEPMQRSASWRERAARSDAIIARYLAGSSYAELSIHEAVDALEVRFGELGVRGALAALGIAQDRPSAGRMYGQYRIHPPNRPDLVGSWDRHAVLQALLIGYLKARDTPDQQHVVAEVYHYLGTPAAEAEPGTTTPDAPTPKPAPDARAFVRRSAAIVLALDLAALMCGIGFAAHPALVRERTPYVITGEEERAPAKEPQPKPRAARVVTVRSEAPRPAEPARPAPVATPILVPCTDPEARSRGICRMESNKTIAGVARVHCGHKAAWRYAMRLALANSVRVPEWGITSGAVDSRRMPSDFLLRFPADSE